MKNVNCGKKQVKKTAKNKDNLSKWDLLGIEYGLAPDPQNPEQCIFKRIDNFSGCPKKK